MAELDIKEVASILNRSTKSIRNYIKDGKLKARKLPSKKGLQYMFEPKAVEDFAKKHLSLSLSINDMDDSESTPPTTNLANEKRKFSNINAQNFIEALLEIENDRLKIVKEFGEYKAQLAYKVGQLESDLKKLENIDKDKVTIESQLKELKKEHTALEREYKIRDEDARQLLNMKEYYENRKWWQFWKGTYEFYNSEERHG